MSALSRRGVFFLAGAAAAALALGCLTKSYPQKRRYVTVIERGAPIDVAANPPGMNPRSGEAPVAGEASVAGVLRVERIRVSPLFERTGFVYRTGDFTFEQDFYNEFYVPPGTMVREATRRWLAASSIFSTVIDAPDPGDSDWSLGGTVDRLFADLRNLKAPQAVVDIDFALKRAGSAPDEEIFRKKYSVVSDAAGLSSTEILAAWNASLSQILRELERDLRAAVSP